MKNFENYFKKEK
jgi:hypothetical protein